MASAPKYDPTPLFNNPQELEKVLYSLTQPNNDDLRHATMLLQKFMEKPESITCLVQQLDKSQSVEVRQVAALYLREQVETFWKKANDDLQGNLKKFLLEKFITCPARPERLAVAACISSTAKFALVADGGWDELLACLQQCCADDRPKDLREIAFTLWRNLVLYCGGSLKRNFGDILTIFQRGLQDSTSLNVRVESTKGIGAMVEFLENDQEIAILENMVPAMVGVIECCLKEGDESNVLSGMEVFIEMMESAVPVLRKHAVQLTNFMLKIASARGELPLTVRKQAVNFMTWMCKSKPKTVMKHDFVKQFLTLCINLIIEGNVSQEVDQNQEGTKDGDSDDEEEEEEGFVTPLGIGCDLLDEIFLNIPSEKCFPLAIQAIQQLLTDADAKKRKGAYVTMAMMAEGCAELICQGQNLAILLKAALQGLGDQDAACRKCALEAVTQFSTHVQSEVLKFHGLVFPNLLKIFTRDNEEVKVLESALNAIEMFIDSIGDNDETEFKVGVYLQALMDIIAACMRRQSKELQVQAVSTLASVAAASKEQFVQYLPRVLDLLERLLTLDDEEQVQLRGEATMCLGAVAMAVGKERFLPVMDRFHKYVMDAFDTIDSVDIRENTFMYFSDLAHLLGPELLRMPTFRDMLDCVLIVMDDDDGMMVKLPDDGFGDGVPTSLVEAVQQSMEEDDDDDTKLDELDDAELEQMIRDIREEAQQAEDAAEQAEDEDEDGFLANAVGQMRTVKLAVTTGFMEEKAAAVHALTFFARYGGREFVQYVEECWQHVLFLWEYPHALVKMALANCVHYFLILLCQNAQDTEEPKFDWKQGQAEMQFPQGVAEFIPEVFPMFIQSITDEDDKDTLAVILDYFVNELRLLGPASVRPYMDDLCQAINKFLLEKCQCQVNTDPDDEETAQVTVKHRWVSDGVAELIGVLASLWGQAFMPPFAKLFPNLMRFAQENRHPHDQAMAIGCVADVASRLKGTTAMEPFAEVAMNTALRIATHQEVNMRQNALYCIGAMYQACSQQAVLQFQEHCLRCVDTFMKLDRGGTKGEQLTRDNAVSALGKMVVSAPESLPVRELLPRFLGALPLSADFSENICVVDVLTELVVSHFETVQPHIQQVLTILAAAMTDTNFEDESKAKIRDFFKQVCQNQTMQQVVSSLAAPAQQVIHQCLQ